MSPLLSVGKPVEKIKKKVLWITSCSVGVLSLSSLLSVLSIGYSFVPMDEKVSFIRGMWVVFTGFSGCF